MPSIKHTLSEIKGDLPNNNFKLSGFVSSYLFSARFRVLLNHRLGKFFFESRNIFLKQLSRRYKYKLITKRNCDISYKAVIGKNFNMPHPLGIVIGEGVIIKDNVTVFQQVTFGSHGRKEKAMEYPVIENNVKIYAGAKIIGGITIGENTIIGANSVINKDVPANSIAYGIPFKTKEIR